MLPTLFVSNSPERTTTISRDAILPAKDLRPEKSELN
jgi:hypothetical protein